MAGRRTGRDCTTVTTVGYSGDRLLQGQLFWCVRPAVPIAASPAEPLYPLPAACLPGQSPASAQQPCMCLSARDGELRATQRGRWCLVSTGDKGGALSCSLVTFPGSASPDSLASGCSITSYSWNVLWARCLDRRLEFLVPSTSSAQKCRLWSLWLVVHLRDKGTGQSAHSW